MFRLVAVCFFITLFSTSICLAADTLNLVTGKSVAEIVISANSSPVEKYAAQELQRVLRIMTGKELPVILASSDPKRIQIVIGTPGTNKDVELSKGVLKLEGVLSELISIQTRGNTLYLTGTNPSSALYATYTFLEDFLAVRWFWPGLSGEFIPNRKTVAISAINFVQQPDLKSRSLAITGVRYGDPDTDTWMARNRMNIVSHSPDSGKSTNLKSRREKGFQVRIAGHNVVLPNSILQQHPEYLAEVGGKRQPHPSGISHLCWSNADVQNEVVKMIGKWWDESPYPDVVHFYPVDQAQYCECSACKSLGDISTRWQKFSTAVINKLNVTHPGKRYWTYAYLQYKTVPNTEPAPFEFIPYTLYDVSYRHLLSSGSKFHDVAMAEMDGWQKKGVNLGIRGYEYIVFDKPMYVPMVSWVTDEMAFFHHRSITGYMSELPPYGLPRTAAPEKTYWNTNRMALYAAGKAMWKSDVKASEIVSDWCSRVYGPAATEMENYYWETEKLWRGSPENISVYTNSAVNHIDEFLPKSVYRNLYQHFQRALAKIEMLPVEKRKRIEEQILLEQSMLDSWHAVSIMKEAEASRYQFDIIKGSTANPLAHSIPLSTAGNLSSAEISIAWNTSDLLISILQDQSKSDSHFDFLIQPDKGKPDFMKFAMEPDGKLSVSTSYSGLSYKISDFKATTAQISNENGLKRIDFSIPLSALHLTAVDGTEFKMAAIESKSELPYAGWPALNSTTTALFANVKLLNEIPAPARSLVLFDHGSNSAPLSINLQERGWKVTKSDLQSDDLKNLKKEGLPVILFRFNDLVKASDTNVKQLRDFVANGGLLILAGLGEVPVHEWFPEVPQVKWIENQGSKPRKSSKVFPGEWLTGQNDLSKILQRGLGPLAAYKPIKNGWDVKAMIMLQNGEDVPFLMSKRIGKGMLVLTSSPIGYNGGYDMFGSRNTLNAAYLIENLDKELKSSQILVK